MRKKYNTPHRSRVVKTRLTEDEYADFTARLAPYGIRDRKSTRLNSSHRCISYAVFCLKKSFFNDTATTEIYTLSLHDALPIYTPPQPRCENPADRR